MAKKKQPEKGPLLFVDTNILLDAYRTQNSKANEDVIKFMLKHIDSLITTSQVEMEFYKNRQAVLITAWKDLKAFSAQVPKSPQVSGALADAKAMKEINNLLKDFNDRQKNLVVRLENFLKNPRENDDVFNGVSSIFDRANKMHLTRETSNRQEIYRKAKQRFMLGYPPRKRQDITIGDCVNWEWIVYCAMKHQKDVVIITRDQDFGPLVGREPIINDWLLREFKDRVGSACNISIMNNWLSAFDLLKQKPSKALEEEEKANQKRTEIQLQTSRSILRAAENLRINTQRQFENIQGIVDLSKSLQVPDIAEGGLLAAVIDNQKRWASMLDNLRVAPFIDLPKFPTANLFPKYDMNEISIEEE